MSSSADLPIIDVSSRMPIPVRPTSAKGTYSFISLGCPKNLVDSERMLGLLHVDGYQLIPEPDGADFVVINTCGFIDRARAESYAAIEEMSELKRRQRIRGIIVSGCLAERQKEALLEECPDVDYVVGVFGREEISHVADRIVGRLDEQRSVFRPAPVTALSDRQRLRITPMHFAFLKISEGCDRLCTFCAIPGMRGKHASKTIPDIMAEARELVASGARELIIVAQDTTYYGLDLYGEPRLTELLNELEEIEDLKWIRLMYFYPMYIDDRLIDCIASSSKIVPYLDIPLQHINDTMLRRMARRVTRADTEQLLHRLRQRIPDLALRTTLITGFPGETDEQFEELAQFVRDWKFERLGVFTYSYEENTPSASLPGHLPEPVKEDRRAHLMEIQRQVAGEWCQSQVGRQLLVIADQRVPDVKNAFVARSYADAPDVDPVVWLSGKGIRVGEFVPCEVVAARNYDLVAAALPEAPSHDRKPSMNGGNADATL